MKHVLDNFLRQRATATRAAYDIPLLSITPQLTDEIVYKISLRIFLFHDCLCKTVSFLESRMPAKNACFMFHASCSMKGTATAATVIGPASGPRPTSSIPISHV